MDRREYLTKFVLKADRRATDTALAGEGDLLPSEEEPDADP
jgi:hypothetical protein